MKSATIRWVRDTTLKRYISILEARINPLKVEKIDITPANINDIVSILQQLCPNALKTVIFELHNDHLPVTEAQMSQLASLKQWKKIQRVEERGLLENPLNVLQYFVHMSDVDIDVQELHIAYFVALKEMIVGPNFKRLAFEFHDTTRNLQEFKEMMGPSESLPYISMNDQTFWYFEAPNGNGVLRVLLLTNSYAIIKLIKQDEVPKGIVVKPMFQFPDVSY